MKKKELEMTPTYKMAVTLCLTLGYPFVYPRIVLEFFTRAELIEWMQIKEEFPFGPEREDERAELISNFAVSSFSGGELFARINLS